MNGERSNLRKKLLARLGLLVVGFVAGAVIAIVLLQAVLRDLDTMNADAAALIDGVQKLSGEVARLEQAIPGATADAEDAIRRTSEELSRHPLLAAPAGAAAGEMQRVSDLVAKSLGASDLVERSLALAQLRSAVIDLGREARQFIAAEQQAVSSDLRWLVIGLTVAALVMVNISCAVLVGTANMILRPIGELVRMCRDLSAERFDSRVAIDQDDEFGELAHAYNAMAVELGALESRKIQAMHQLAVTLNHELLNVISAINLQLQLVDRRSGSDPATAGRLRDIHEGLDRLAATISSLRNVRRIVLTDYMPGEKMLDLTRSVADDDAGQPDPPRVQTTRSSAPGKITGAAP
ncbi:MAG: HAMP domain-containing protein [Phycisphaerales bacterium]|nr:HAMP domain-containing protein [Phycisphaerales bacterium]